MTSSSPDESEPSNSHSRSCLPLKHLLSSLSTYLSCRPLPSYPPSPKSSPTLTNTTSTTISASAPLPSPIPSPHRYGQDCRPPPRTPLPRHPHLPRAAPAQTRALQRPRFRNRLRPLGAPGYVGREIAVEGPESHYFHVFLEFHDDVYGAAF
ncbi:hypothetical protein GRF29_1g440080 [Pseudopithomyces chartarum]|uniref:Uncharacterized protein n=1 Tax=Pseudopithomyces chartarum TaxID=1892770 RepID=A0AAN6M6C8_9PLEO|nr:hypothetical protein GRF29_1g440080 [Pseudopithomyces chartarum]